MSKIKRKTKLPPAEKSGNTFKYFFGEEYTRTELFYLGLIVLLGLIFRLIYFFETEGTPFFTHLYSDSKIYFDWASSIITSGDWVGTETYFMSPIYPYFLALLKTLSNQTITIVRLIQVIVSSLNIWIIFLIARKIHSPKAGYAASILASVYSIFIFYSGAILAETFQTFVVSILILLLVNVVVFENVDKLEKTADRWLTIGLLLGVSALFRGNILLFFVGALGWMIIHYRGSVKLKAILKPALIYFIFGTAVPILMVTTRNYLVSNELVLITSNGGINFYIGNNSSAPGVFKTPKDFNFLSDMSGKDYAEKMSGEKMTSSKASLYWYKQGFDYITSHPVDASVLTVKKLFLFLGNSENPQSTIMDPLFFSFNYSNLLKLPLPGFGLILILALSGIILTFREREKIILLYIFLTLYILSVIIFFVVGRYRVAITPLLLVFAGVALMEIYHIMKSGHLKKLISPSVVAVLLVLIESFAVPKLNYSNYDAYLNLGNTSFDEKDFDKALAYYKLSLQSEKNYIAYVLIGNTLSVKREFQAAEAAYKTAIKLNDLYDISYFNLGLMYTQTRQIEKSINQFNKAIEINPHFSEAYRNLAIAFYMKGEYKFALEYFEKYLPMANNPDIRKSVVRDIENIKEFLKSNK